ncbi:unnamed protein product [Dracunculus medinensis]|uniref:G_PROTEIN_RECEP_F1_2 domain-containing protein n=1 Tax=Dracunculus medinensis TaxID=318479 RepID=A0A0N4UAX6_DRAME|nr:unnamed protein product [Dracunculus medinensis]
MLRSSNAVIYVVISVNRYYAVMNPLKYSLKFTPTIAYRVCCGILFISVLIWSPLALDRCSFYFNTELYRYGPRNSICSIRFWQALLFSSLASTVAAFIISVITLIQLKKSNKLILSQCSSAAAGNARRKRASTINKASTEKDMVIIGGDWNASLGDDANAMISTIGKYGIGDRCANGERLLRYAEKHELFVTFCYCNVASDIVETI